MERKDILFYVPLELKNHSVQRFIDIISSCNTTTNANAAIKNGRSILETGGFYHADRTENFETYRQSNSQRSHLGGWKTGRRKINMAADVETMFSVRVKPWHGIGTIVENCPDSEDALRLAGLDWKVQQKEVCTSDGTLIPGYKANVRDFDQSILGVVSDRYQVVQNEEAFAFTDELLAGGVRYETAGALQGGKRTFLLARLPQRFIIAGDEISPYFVIMNSHDGSCSIKAAMTPVRVVCQNTLNLAFRRAKRTWMTKHTTNIMERIEDARATLQFAEQYMGELGKGIDDLARKRLTDKKVMEYMSEFFPVTEDMTAAQKKNNLSLLNDMKARYFDAPDLQGLGKNGYRFINAVSDFATHAEPIRRTKNYRENLFLKTVDGNPLIDRAYQMANAA